VETLQKIYQTLELDGFNEVKKTFEEYADSQKEYKKNKFSMEPELKEKIASRWKRYFERYGYEE
jgi:DNA-binding transcriptional regulator YhcF (GntR family)